MGEGGGGADSRRCSVLERTCRSRQTEALREWGRRRVRHETASWTSVSCQMVLRVSSRPPPLPVPGHCETHRSPEASPTCAENTESALARSRERKPKRIRASGWLPVQGGTSPSPSAPFTRSCPCHPPRTMCETERGKPSASGLTDLPLARSGAPWPRSFEFQDAFCAKRHMSWKA